LKKTPGQAFDLNAANDTLCEHYEQMRSYVLEASASGQIYGLAVMLQKGMCAWVEVACEYVQPKNLAGGTDLKRQPVLLSSAQKELSAMIAGMILNHGWKEVFESCR
jgi:hypothetical protein